MQAMIRTESVNTMSRHEHRKMYISAGGTRKEADAAYRATKHQETWANELYVVQVNRHCYHGFGDKVEDMGGMFELTLRRQDRGAHIDWRHVQQIKNQIIGPEHEMTQLFPKESRLRDAANQYWFYGFNHEAMIFPFGMLGRFVDDEENAPGKSKQRKLS